MPTRMTVDQQRAMVGIEPGIEQRAAVVRPGDLAAGIADDVRQVLAASQDRESGRCRARSLSRRRRRRAACDRENGPRVSRSQNGLPFASRSPSSRTVSVAAAAGRRQSLGYSAPADEAGIVAPTGRRSRGPSCRPRLDATLHLRQQRLAAGRRSRRASSRRRNSRPRGRLRISSSSFDGSSITSCQFRRAATRTHRRSSIPWWRLTTGRLEATGGCTERSLRILMLTDRSTGDRAPTMATRRCAPVRGATSAAPSRTVERQALASAGSALLASITIDIAAGAGPAAAARTGCAGAPAQMLCAGMLSPFITSVSGRICANSPILLS